MAPRERPDNHHLNSPRSEIRFRGVRKRPWGDGTPPRSETQARKRGCGLALSILLRRPPVHTMRLRVNSEEPKPKLISLRLVSLTRTPRAVLAKAALSSPPPLRPHAPLRPPPLDLTLNISHRNPDRQQFPNGVRFPGGAWFPFPAVARPVFFFDAFAHAKNNTPSSSSIVNNINMCRFDRTVMVNGGPSDSDSSSVVDFDRHHDSKGLSLDLNLAPPPEVA
ncbi:hypothetical protein OIU84_002942 [Salix udensis]|uniref:Uncharacterized protein n=1 Tax=Salix udensis TaxID=889485 RepID=A0AAD6K774_9ROSI|nr:hypothetical protein OIU84_002942 [Salix udensis]